MFPHFLKKPPRPPVATIVAHQDNQGPDFVLCDKSHDAAEAALRTDRRPPRADKQVKLTSLVVLTLKTDSRVYPCLTHDILTATIRMKGIVPCPFSAWLYLLPELWGQSTQAQELCTKN